MCLFRKAISNCHGCLQECLIRYVVKQINAPCLGALPFEEPITNPWKRVCKNCPWLQGDCTITGLGAKKNDGFHPPVFLQWNHQWFVTKFGAWSCTHLQIYLAFCEFYTFFQVVGDETESTLCIFSPSQSQQSGLDIFSPSNFFWYDVRCGHPKMMLGVVIQK